MPQCFFSAPRMLQFAIARRHHKRRCRKLACVAAVVALLALLQADAGPQFKVVDRDERIPRPLMDWEQRKLLLRANVPGYSDFFKRYRMSLPVFEKLLEKIKDDMPREAKDGTGHVISAELWLSMALRWFAGGSIWDIADMHGVS
eukprot:SAG31_NODE_3_length_45830_cov_42.279701_7_plen_145_part_00